MSRSLRSCWLGWPRQLGIGTRCILLRGSTPLCTQPHLRCPPRWLSIRYTCCTCNVELRTVGFGPGRCRWWWWRRRHTRGLEPEPPGVIERHCVARRRLGLEAGGNAARVETRVHQKTQPHREPHRARRHATPPVRGCRGLGVEVLYCNISYIPG